jgi:hypothetical protein
MFPETEKATEQRRSRIILVLGALAAAILAVIVMFVARSKPPASSELENVYRAGSPEFEAAKAMVGLEVIDKIVHPNMIGMAQYEVQARLTNKGTRPITAVEVIGRIKDLQDQVVASNVSIPIPKARSEPLQPGESIKITVKVDAPAKITEDQVKDIVLELRGVRF